MVQSCSRSPTSSNPRLHTRWRSLPTSWSSRALNRTKIATVTRRHTWNWSDSVRSLQLRALTGHRASPSLECWAYFVTNEILFFDILLADLHALLATKHAVAQCGQSGVLTKPQVAGSNPAPGIRY